MRIESESSLDSVEIDNPVHGNRPGDCVLNEPKLPENLRGPPAQEEHVLMQDKKNTVSPPMGHLQQGVSSVVSKTFTSNSRITSKQEYTMMPEQVSFSTKAMPLEAKTLPGDSSSSPLPVAYQLQFGVPATSKQVSGIRNRSDLYSYIYF